MNRATEPLTLASPDGNITVTFELKSKLQPYLPGERAYYCVSYKGVPILADSPLGLDLLGMRSMDRDFEIIGSNRSSVRNSWENAFGAKRHVDDRCEEMVVQLRERLAPYRRVDLVFRAYDEGVAFRYFLPRQSALEKFTISSENTGFYLARDVSAFALDLGRYQSPYESEFRRVTLDQIKPASIIGLPLLVEVPGGPWVALLEAELTDYAGMYVGGVPRIDNALMSKLSPLPGRDGRGNVSRILRALMSKLSPLVGRRGPRIVSRRLRALMSKLSPPPRRPELAVVASTPKATPWRVLMISSRPGGLIEGSDLILNLSEPNKLADTSWIQPGKSAWDWWSGSFARNVDFNPGMNTATLKHYVGFAARHHLEYMLIDVGWSSENDVTRSVPEVDLPGILAYARSEGVKVILWMNWKAVKKQIDEAFLLYERWGVSGVKIDYMERDDQEMVNFYEEMVRKAAEHHLVVALHGAFKPTGLRRAYPNLLTCEAIMGMEHSKSSDRVTPEHDVTIPFTRMLAGPMDYTPGCFQNATRKQFKPRNVEPMCQGTRAHQLAMYVVYLSPLAMLSDYPESYDRNPGIDFLEKVPTVWDDTKALNGEPAQYVTIARQRGDTWYLGSMTNWDARDLEIPLDFLGSRSGGLQAGTLQYEAQIYADGADADKIATSLSIRTRRVSSRGTLSLHLAPGGGAAVIFTPTR